MSEQILLESFNKRVWLVESPLNPIESAFVQYLHAERYAPTSTRMYLGVLAHFGYWMSSRQLTLLEINQVLIDEFINSHLASCACPGRCRRVVKDVRSALKHLLFVAHKEQRIIVKPAPSNAIDVELEKFRNYLLNGRAVAGSTSRYMIEHVRDLLTRKSKSAGTRNDLTAQDVEEFVIEYARRWKPASLKHIRASLKNYLNFRALQGDATESMIAALPIIARASRPKLPNILTETQLAKFLASFDQSQPTGQRDYAIARCLIDLGLRGNEVAQLTLESIDWRAAMITVSGGKRRQVHKLPLPCCTGKAIARYLCEGRPKSNNRKLFVRHVAPYEKPISISTIRMAMTRGFERCGLNEFCSTHILRHTAASRFLNAGASIKELADVLGHRSIESTKYYTRVDLASLSNLALPWPEEKQ